MKKTVLSIGLLTALAFGVKAQDATTTSAGSEFKPSAGNVTFEINALSPFAQADPFRLNQTAVGGAGLLRFRYFLSEGTAIRLGFGISKDGFNRTYNNTTTTSTTPATGNGSSTTTVSDKITVKSSSFDFSIMPGIEFHKNVSERLSVYYGGYIDFSMGSRKGSVEAAPGNSSTTSGSTTSNSTPWSGSYKEEIKGGWFGDDVPASVTMATGVTNVNTSPITGVTIQNGNNDRGYTRIGLFGVIGADFYITKALYLGVEGGWGFANTKYKSAEVTRTGSIGNGTTPATTTTPPQTSYSYKADGKDGAKSFTITPSVNAAFRLGFWF